MSLLSLLSLGSLPGAHATKIGSGRLSAFEGQLQGIFISFETPALMFKVLTQKRWELLSALTGAGPVTLREAAHRVERDVKAVHGDVHALLDAGLLQKTVEGRILFPFDACASTSC